MAALKRSPPELIFTGYTPFRALRAFLNERYLPSGMVAGLWVRRDDFGRFEGAGAKSGGIGGRAGESQTALGGQGAKAPAHRSQWQPSFEYGRAVAAGAYSFLVFGGQRRAFVRPFNIRQSSL
jgi:hypothetical protein